MQGEGIHLPPLIVSLVIIFQTIEPILSRDMVRIAPLHVSCVVIGCLVSCVVIGRQSASLITALIASST